jgi:hypothetical protein
MDQDTTVNNALRDLKFKDIIKEKDSSYAQLILEGVWASGWEYQRAEDKKNRQGTCERITYYGIDNESLGTYESITQASDELVIPRKTICHSLRYKTARMRNGHYFKYAEDEKRNND